MWGTLGGADRTAEPRRALGGNPFETCVCFSGLATVTPAFTFDDILTGLWNRLVREFLLLLHGPY